LWRREINFLTLLEGGKSMMEALALGMDLLTAIFHDRR
jgi:hypothetical protein